MSDNAHFADAFNFLIYNGRPMIDPGMLQPLDPAEIVIPYGNDSRAPEQKYRDVLKLWQAMTDGNTIYAVLGEELQAKVHYAMPVKDMLYDAMHYAKQVEEANKSYRHQEGKKQQVRLTSAEFLSGFRKGDKLMPVITLVIYFGASEWDGPMSIHEMLSTKNEELLQFVPDYRINLIAPANMADNDFLKFRTDFGKVLQFIKYSQNKEKLYKLIQEDDRFRNIDEDSANLINVTTSSVLNYEVKGGQVDMCKAIDEMRQESRNEGWNDGVLETLAGLVNDGVLTLSQAAARAGISPAEFIVKTGASPQPVRN